MRPFPSRPRFADWPERLTALVEERREAPFYWGGQDCGMFAADVALALTGEDPAAWLRGKYGDEEALDHILADLGGFEEAVALTMQDFGSPEIAPAFAMRGDWGLVEFGNQLMVGVVLGDVVAIPALDGLRFPPVALVRRAWAI
jgi:hypothetical protein